jgi:iron complex outermembrane recepter protein
MPSLLAALVLSPAAAAQAQEADSTDFSKMNLEQLMEVEVTSVSKRPQKANEVAAAVFVITQEDIRTSGATNIPQVLRMAPGVEVAQLDANKWAITIRGFNGRYANKLLVLQDGRNLYTPVYGGVFWDLQDTMLQDIERIEVIRGPGGTLWGANAVNGVINIITKNAKDTQGALAFAEAGTELLSGGGRYGARIGEDLHVRGFAKYLEQDNSVLPSGQQASDAWNQGRMGFRADWDPKSGDEINVSSEIFTNPNTGTDFIEYSFVPPFESLRNDHGTADGGFILANWKHEISDDSRIAVSSYYDRYSINQRGLGNTLETYDINMQHEIDVDLWMPNQFTWGAEYRYYSSELRGHENFSADPRRRDDNLFSGFVQNEIALIEDTLRLTIGSKFLQSDTSGFEVQPSARMIWTPDNRHSVWGSVSRGVRTPSYGEQNVDILLSTLPPGSPNNPGPLPVGLFSIGNPSAGSEEVIAYELGWRVQPLDNLSLDFATFYNDYDRLIASVAGAPALVFAPTPRIIVPLSPENKGSGESYGGEVAVNWNVTPWLGLRGAYSYLDLDLDQNVSHWEGRSPHNQVSLRALVDLGADWELDFWLRYVDQLDQPRVNDYLTGDVRLAWKPIKELELSIVGQNLFQDRHQEFASDIGEQVPGEVQRSVYGKVEVRF